MRPTCGHCGWRLPHDARFCPGCGRGVTLGPGRPEDERRQLTLFFCDLVNSTSLASSLDAEDWSDLLQAYHAACRQALLGLDAHVAQYLGDGVLAYFGYPRAEEDDCERALRAGLAVLAAIEVLNRSRPAAPALEVRVGTHVGWVVLSQPADVSRAETLAHGDAVNLVFRLTEQARPGTLVTSQAVLHRLPGLFLNEPLGPLRLRGFPEPVRAYRVSGARDLPSRFDARADEDLSPLVGRERETRALQRAWCKARSGEPSVAIVEGEAGIGKSRLVHVLRRTVEGESAAWLACGCWPYEQHSAFHPIVHGIRHTLGWERLADDAARRRSLARVLGESDFDAELGVALLAPLLAFESDPSRHAPDLTPEERRERTLETLLAWLRGRFGKGPGVLVVEDLHWSDPSTLELIGRLLANPPRGGVLTVLTHRPGFEAPWPDPPGSERISLERLGPAECARLARLVAGAQRLSQGALRSVVARSDGIPLFVEELTRGAVESPAEEPAGTRRAAPGGVPETLQASLFARVDGLPTAKQLVQVASVAGREFSRALLAEVTGLGPNELARGLAELVETRLIERIRNGDAERYWFRHALLRDASYQSLLRGRRRELHAHVAEALERIHPEVAERSPEILAHHLTEAELTQRAIAAWRRAGERAVESWSGEEAVRHYRTAIALTDTLAESSERNRLMHELYMKLCLVLFMMRGTGSSEVMEALRAGREHARRARNPTDLNVLTALLAGSHSMRAEYEAGRELSERGLEQLEETARWEGWTLPVRVVRSIHLATLGTALLFAGRLREALAVAEAGIAEHDPAEPMALQVGMTDPSMVAFVNAGFLHTLPGRPDHGLALARQGVALVSGRPAAYSQSYAHARMFEALVHLERDEPERAREVALGVARFSEERGMRFFRAGGRLIAAAADAAGPDPARAARELEAALAEGAELETRFAGTLWLAARARAELRCGRADAALGHLTLADAFAAATGEGFYLAELQRVRGEALLAAEPPRPEESRRAVEAAIATAKALGASTYALRAAVQHVRCQLDEDGALLDPAPLRAALGACERSASVPLHLEAERLLASVSA